MTDAVKLAESLRAMRRNAQMHYSPDGKTPRYSIVIDNDTMLDMTKAAGVIEQLAAALAEAEAYLVAAADGSMSRNNSEALAAEFAGDRCALKEAPVVLLTDEMDVVGGIMDAVLAAHDAHAHRADDQRGYENSRDADDRVRDLIVSAICKEKSPVWLGDEQRMLIAENSGIVGPRSRVGDAHDAAARYSRAIEAASLAANGKAVL